MTVALAVAVVLAGVAGCRAGFSAADVVTRYFAALARGDAAAALRYGLDRPASTNFLTDEILKKQLAKAPISDVTVVRAEYVTGSFGTSDVQVSVRFGDQTMNETFAVRRSKLEYAAVELKGLADGHTMGHGQDALTIFGEPVGSTTPYVFPGAIVVGSASPNMGVKTNLDVVTLESLRLGVNYRGAEFTLNERGRDAAMSAITAAVAECGKSRLMAPPHCPQRVRGDDLVDGTVTWKEPALGEMKTSFSGYSATLTFGVTTAFPLTVGTKSGGTRSGAVDAYVGGHVDMTRNPPVVTFD